MRHLATILAVAVLTTAAPSQSATSSRPADAASSLLTVAPELTVTGMGITPIVTSGTGTPVTIIDVDAGTDVVFCWTADASAYGGTITDYQYAFDIADVSDPAQWDIPWTTFDGTETCSPTHAFYFGTHTFTIQVRDDSANISRAAIKLNIVTAPLAAETSTWGRVKALYR